MIKLLMILFFSTDVFAAGKGDGSVSDLLFPAINFVILFGFIIFKYKGTLSKNYTKKSQELETLLNDAAEADKQASLKLEMLKRQFGEIDVTKKELEQKAEKNLNSFVEKIDIEAANKMSKLKDDCDSRFEQEKNNLDNKVNSQVLDLVIDNAKEIIVNDDSKKKTAAEKLVSSIN